MSILVRGAADIGSAVAHRLFCAGYAVMIHDSPWPVTSRRGMAFSDAIFDGEIVFEGVKAIRIEDLDDLPSLLSAHVVLPVLVSDLAEVIRAAKPDVLVDARMRKHNKPEVQLAMATLTIGLGPGFVAGETTDLVVETAWGDDLGKVISVGAALPLAGEPRSIGGAGRERYVYAPAGGVFRTTREIGERVRAGENVANIDTCALVAPIDGVLRGLVHDGVPVTAGTKVIEVDPRSSAPVVRGIAERPSRIADGVLQAVRHAPLRTER